MQEARIINLPKIEDKRGNLSFLESGNHIPFDIERVYWIYDVPGGQFRGGHAYKIQEEIIIALSGSFDIVVDNGTEKLKFQLNRSYYGLYVPKGYWRHVDNFSTNTLALAVCSTQYDKNDYIRDYNDFIKYKQTCNQ